MKKQKKKDMIENFSVHGVNMVCIDLYELEVDDQEENVFNAIITHFLDTSTEDNLKAITTITEIFHENPEIAAIHTWHLVSDLYGNVCPEVSILDVDGEHVDTIDIRDLLSELEDDQ
jgi:hypothetical protein